MICEQCLKLIESLDTYEEHDLQWHINRYGCEQCKPKESVPEPLKIHMAEIVGAKGKFK